MSWSPGVGGPLTVRPSPMVEPPKQAIDSIDPHFGPRSAWDADHRPGPPGDGKTEVRVATIITTREKKTNLNLPVF